MLGLGATEIILILLLVLLFFGGRRIPEIAKGLGSGIRNFKRSVREPDELEGDREQRELEGEERSDRE